ncbi:hypothetical protein E8E13_004305 [Curvularia kusanoi]|uniref:Ubiquitin 3 binding protein But2 C-terminal domain-containing protein n=1 Tax=Curvularia kusanoi TaxID=90978 RepID=A0A9P4T8T0_CURKU|nr:hypothetical protein E8E13_004305 [Curvularia kusanoi]
MKYAFASVAFGLGANALVARDASQCYQLKASGGQSGVLGQLGDGQNRVGGGHPTGCYCLSSEGGFTDSNGRGCILTPPTTQFQCDVGAKPTNGFAVGSSGSVTYNGSSKFYACPATDSEYNVYTSPVKGQDKCVEISLSSAGSCGAGSGQASSPAASQPAKSTAMSQPSQPAQSYPAQSPPAQSQPAPKPSQPAQSYPAQSQPAPKPSQPAPQPSAPAPSQPAPKPSQPAQSYPAQSPPIPGPPAASQPGTCQVVTVTVTQTQPAPVASQPAPKPSAPAQSQPAPMPSAPAPSQPAPKPSQPAPQPSAPAQSYPAQSQPASKPSQPAQSQPAPMPSAPAQSGGKCPTDLNGAYQYPHLIVPVDSQQSSKTFGTSYNGKVNSHTCSIFNFDIPTSYSGKTCSVVFLFPEKKDLETSSYTVSGSGKVNFTKLKGPASQQTTYANQPGKESDLASMSIAPGNSYSIASGACAAGQTVSYEICSEGDFALDYFQDYNPSPLGLYVRQC